VIPYLGEFTMIGTTDVPWEGEPGPATIDAAETDYLCDVASRGFRRHVSATDVRWSFAGIRALQDDGSARASAITRDYALDLDALEGLAPVLTVVGGKLTTYRILAELALDKLKPCFGDLAPAWTATAPLPGGNIAGGDFEALPAALGRLFPFLTAAESRRLARAYGTRAMRLLEGAASRADLGESFGGGVFRLEVDYLRREEWARSADDVLWRHTKAGLWATPAEVQRLRAYMGR
jgi:glycerol-3-phosphate dehydrogenase